MQPELGEVIAQIRGERQMSSREELANAADISPKTVERIEKGGNYRPQTLANIAAALDCTVDELMERARKWRTGSISVETALSAKKAVPPYIDPLTRADTRELSNLFESLDTVVALELGEVYSHTRGKQVGYSSRRLFTSLSMIDIPPEIALYIVMDVPRALNSIKLGSEFDTGDIRLAVSQVITDMPIERFENSEDLVESSVDGAPLSHREKKIRWEQKKNDWAQRYSRRFGDPNQIIQVILLDGSETKLDYTFLKKTLVPEMLDRLLGSKILNTDFPMITSSEIGEISENLLAEFRRLGLYSLRFRSALWLAEEIALQPPNPWFVTDETRESTVSYDLGRARAHLDRLNSQSGEMDHDGWHRFEELVRHCCSAILATYGGFLGLSYLAPLRQLMSWLRIRDNNIVLWKSCELKFIEDDLLKIESKRDDFYRFLQKLDVRIKAHDLDSVEAAQKYAKELFGYTEQLYQVRESKRRLTAAVNNNERLSLLELVTVCRENILAIFDRAKPHNKKSAIFEEIIGFTATLNFAGTAFEGKSVFCVIAAYDSLDDQRSFEDAVDQAIDLLRGHRLSEIAFLIHRGPLTSSQEEYLDESNRKTEKGVELFSIPLDRLMEIAKRAEPRETFLDALLHRS